MADSLESGSSVQKSATEARSGVTGNGVRHVLVWGTFGVVVAFIVIYLVFFR